MALIEAPLFHITQVVEDLDAGLDCFRRLFGLPVLDGGYWDVPRRHAIFIFVGDTWLEAMAPDLHSGGLRDFVGRFGGHLHSLAWYVQGIDEFADRLRRRGVRFFDSEGDIIAGPVPRHGPMPLPPGYRHSYPEGWSSAVLYTSFRDSYGMIELCEPSSVHPLPPRVPDPDMVGGADPLKIQGTSHQTIVVPSADEAVAFAVEVLGARLVHQGNNPVLKARSSFVEVGPPGGSVLEYAEPVEDGPAAADLARFGRPVLHTATFRVRDLERVREHLKAESFIIESDSGVWLVTDPATMVGARFGFTEAVLPWSVAE